jgi:hypothetical protein
MIKGEAKFGDLTLHAFGPFPSGSQPPADTAMSALLKQAARTFLTCDVSGYPQSIYDNAHHGFKYNGVTYNPVLCNDNWGGGGWTDDGSKTDSQGTFLNPSYFDPTTLAGIYEYANNSQNGMSDLAKNLYTAVQNSVAYLQVLQNQFNGALPDNPAWNEGGVGPHPVGWDSIRFLSNAGKYVAAGQDPFGIIDTVKTMGTTMLNYVLAHSENNYQPNMILDNTPNGAQISGGALLGPLLVAMKALTPDDPNIGTVENSLTASLDIDMDQMQGSSGYTYWQNQYYGIQLGLVNQYDASQIPPPS